MNVSVPSSTPPPIILTKKDRRRLEALIAEHAPIQSWGAVAFLAHELNRASVVADRDTPRNVVTMHSRVAFQDGDSEAVQTATLVYPGERAMFEDALSVITPLGAALIGLAPGQALSYPAADGVWKTVKVLQILYQPEAVRRAEMALKPRGAPRPPEPQSHGDTPVIDAHRRLAHPYHKEIRRRLEARGCFTAGAQSAMLAAALDYEDPDEIWAVLMWNACPSPALAGKLTRWIVAGMPLGVTSFDAGSAAGLRS